MLYLNKVIHQLTVKLKESTKIISREILKDLSQVKLKEITELKKLEGEHAELNSKLEQSEVWNTQRMKYEDSISGLQVELARVQRTLNAFKSEHYKAKTSLENVTKQKEQMQASYNA